MTGTLVTLAFAFMIVGPRFGEFLARHLGLSWAFAMIWPALRYVLAVSFTIVAVVQLYLVAPNLKQRLRLVSSGSGGGRGGMDSVVGRSEPVFPAGSPTSTEPTACSAAALRY